MVSFLIDILPHHTIHPKSQTAVFPLDTEKIGLFDGLH